MFSWYKNGSNLLTTKSNPDSISVLHGVRVFSIIWVVMGHSYEFHSYLPQINYLYGLETIRKWRLLYITNAVLAVDTCFVLSGLLLSYIFMKTMDNGHQFNLPMFYIHRFIRIMPVLVMIVLLEASLMSKIGSGPLWELGVVNTLQKNCKKYWWSTLLFVQNYVNVENMCIPASWYLAVDMQMYWISPIFLLALHKKPKFGISLLTAAVFMGVAVAFQQAYFFEDLASGVPTNGKINDRYYQTHSRFVPWVIGLTCGYLLYRTTEWRKKVALHKAKLSKYILLSGWASSIIIFIGVIHWVYHFEQINYVYNAIDSSLYIALARPLWASAVSWVIFACSSGYGGFVNTILEWKALIPLSRLTFCIYLLHVDVITAIMATSKTSGYMSDSAMIHSFLGYMVLTVLVSIVMTLTVEAPILGLEKILFKRVQNSSNSKDEQKAVIHEEFAIQQTN